MDGRIIIRFATELDAGLVRDLLDQMALEMAMFEVDDDLVDERIQQVLRFGVCFLAFIDSKPAGTIGLLGERASWFTHEKVIRDTWCFVAHEYRPLRVFASLIHQCQLFAHHAGLPLHFQLFTLADTDRKMKLFTRHAQAMLSRFYRFSPIGGEFKLKRLEPR